MVYWAVLNAYGLWVYVAGSDATYLLTVCWCDGCPWSISDAAESEGSSCRPGKPLPPPSPRTGRTDSAAKQHNTLCTVFSERGEQILQQSNTTLCTVFQNGENRFCSKVTQHAVYKFLRTGEQILQQSNTTLCVQVSQNGEITFCSKTTQHSVYWILGTGRTDSAAKQHNILCPGFSEWERTDSAAKQHNTLCTVYLTLRGEQIGVCVSLR